MMIGPGSFIAENIEGKRREEAVKEVKSLWREIRRLKKMLEEESQSEEMMYHPSPGVRISVYHDYIEACKAYFDPLRPLRGTVRRRDADARAPRTGAGVPQSEAELSLLSSVTFELRLRSCYSYISLILLSELCTLLSLSIWKLLRA